MIRAAKFIDTPRIVELLVEMQASSKYAGHVRVDEKIAHKLIAQCVHRHGHTTDGGSLVMVAVHDDQVEGFIVGMLDRVYHIGDLLAANDVFLYCSKRADPGDFIRLFDAYVEWATKNPRVFEIRASWTNARIGAEKIERMYERRGFEQCGAIFEKRPAEMRKAA